MTPSQTITGQVKDLTGRAPKRVNILDTAVLVRVKFGKVGTSRKLRNTVTKVMDDTTGVEVEKRVFEINAEEDSFNVSKKLLRSPEMKAVTDQYGEVRKWMASRVNYSGIDKGIYWIGLKGVKAFEEGMQSFVSSMDPVLDNLEAAYNAIIERDRERLKGAFDPSDYPAKENLRKAFSISWQYMELVAPRSMAAVTEELYKKAQDDINSSIRVAQDAVQLALRKEMLSLVCWATDRLAPDAETGKRKILRTKTKNGQEIGLTAKLKSFFETFQGRNITSDTELETLVARAEAIMTGVDGDALKGSDALRDSVRDEFNKIKAELEPLVTSATEEPFRNIEVV